MLPEAIRKFFVRADLGREGLNPLEYAQRWTGTMGYNNGILSVVDTEGTVWVSALQVFKTCAPWDPDGISIQLVEEFQSLYGDGNFLSHALQEAGYENIGMWIPHSNGDQDWVRAQMADAGITRQVLIREIEARRISAATEARLQKIAAIAASAPSA